MLVTRQMRGQGHQEIAISTATIAILRKSLSSGLSCALQPLALGDAVMWRGMRRLADMQLGFNLASEEYG